MELGDKIKLIRKKFGLSQDELGAKLNVSRQAITKWENNNGMPDVENLKEISQLFGVTVDFLLDNNVEVPLLTMKQKINIEEYDLEQIKTEGKYRTILKNNFNDEWKIYNLTREKEMNIVEGVIDFITFGVVKMADLSTDPYPYFLAQKDNMNLLVHITKEYMEVIELNESIDKQKFKVESNRFSNIGILYE